MHGMEFDKIQYEEKDVICIQIAGECEDVDTQYINYNNRDNR